MQSRSPETQSRYNFDRVSECSPYKAIIEELLRQGEVTSVQGAVALRAFTRGKTGQELARLLNQMDGQRMKEMQAALKEAGDKITGRAINHFVRFTRSEAAPPEVLGRRRAAGAGAAAAAPAASSGASGAKAPAGVPVAKALAARARAGPAAKASGARGAEASGAVFTMPPPAPGRRREKDTTGRWGPRGQWWVSDRGGRWVG